MGSQQTAKIAITMVMSLITLLLFLATKRYNMNFNKNLHAGTVIAGPGGQIFKQSIFQYEKNVFFSWSDSKDCFYKLFVPFYCNKIVLTFFEKCYLMSKEWFIDHS
jgi:hypothetical protein